MNKIAIAFFAVIAVAAAGLLPGSPESLAQTTRSEQVVNPDSFQYAFDTSNGITAQESGQLKQVGADAAVATQGSFGWTSPEGVPVQVTYVADENGYQPQSPLLPVAPAIPEAIARALQYLASIQRA